MHYYFKKNYIFIVVIKKILSKIELCSYYEGFYNKKYPFLYLNNNQVVLKKHP